MSERQQILHLWLVAAALDTDVAGWAFYDGADGTGSELPDRGNGSPPYRSGVDALRDGWILFQTPGPLPVEQSNGELAAEFVFERRVTQP